MDPIVVVGAGAAGMLAALFARRAGRPVTLIERTRDGGRKILISGGGRCNILPSRPEPERFVTGSSRHSLRNILRSWPLGEQIAFFERELGTTLELEPETGKLFPGTRSARQVRDRLVERVRAAGVTMCFGVSVSALRPPSAEEDGWEVELEGAPPVKAVSVILACGGLSIPSTGSDGTGLRLARAMGHSIHPTYPALTPLTATPAIHAHLAGVSLDVTIRAPGTRPPFRTSGGFLFTHRGYSGPAVLDASHLATRSVSAGAERQELRVQWTTWDRAAWDSALIEGKGKLGPLLSRRMPTRVAAQLLAEAAVGAEVPLAQLDRRSRGRLVAFLADYPLPWNGHEGYRKAEVTGGGIPLSEIDPGTMESRVVRGLFLCGEMLDAFGPIGGHNFQWAWTTGRAAGLGAVATYPRRPSAV